MGVFVVAGVVGWSTQAMQDQVFNAVESGRVGKAQFTAGINVKEPVGTGQFGNQVRVEFNVATDADAVWNQLKTFLTANTPSPGSHVRRLDCDWDNANTGCVIVQELLWLPDGSLLIRP